MAIGAPDDDRSLRTNIYDDPSRYDYWDDPSCGPNPDPTYLTLILTLIGSAVVPMAIGEPSTQMPRSILTLSVIYP